MYYIMVYWISKQISRTHSGKKQLQLQSNAHISLKIGRMYLCLGDRTVILVSKMQNGGRRTTLRFVSQTHFESCDFSPTIIPKSLYFSARCNTLPVKGRKREKETNAFFSETYLLRMLFAQLPTEII